MMSNTWARIEIEEDRWIRLSMPTDRKFVCIRVDVDRLLRRRSVRELNKELNPESPPTAAWFSENSTN